jgi:hypothetical protein
VAGLLAIHVVSMSTLKAATTAAADHSKHSNSMQQRTLLMMLKWYYIVGMQKVMGTYTTASDCWTIRSITANAKETGVHYSGKREQ